MPDRPPMPTMVSIHLPTCNAPPDRVRRALTALAALDYATFEVLVVDHNTADPALWEPVSRDCARLGARFRFFHLGPWPSGRAGALNFARTQASDRAEVIAVLDGDAVVGRDWLHEAVTAFANPRVGIVRSPCLVRKTALDGVGGWAEWTVTEDAALDLALAQARWLAAGPATPSDRGAPNFTAPHFTASRERVARQAYGAAQIGRRHWRAAAVWLPRAVDALGLLLLIINVMFSMGLVLAHWRFGAASVLLALSSIGLLAARLVRIRRAGLAAVITGLALRHTAARAFWTAMLDEAGLRQRAAHPGGAPMRMDGLPREELGLLLLTWAALAGVAAMHGFTSWRAVLWCAALLAQSMPYLAAVSLTALAAWLARQPKPSGPDPAAVARSGAGD